MRVKNKKGVRRWKLGELKISSGVSSWCFYPSWGRSQASRCLILVVSFMLVLVLGIHSDASMGNVPSLERANEDSVGACCSSKYCFRSALSEEEEDVTELWVILFCEDIEHEHDLVIQINYIKGPALFLFVTEADITDSFLIFGLTEGGVKFGPSVGIQMWDMGI